MLPSALIETCADSPVLTAFLEVVGRAMEPVEGLPVKARLEIVRLGRSRVLPNVWMMERGDDGQFRYRLAGEEVVRSFGHSLRGKTLEEVIGPAATARYAPILDSALADRAVIYHRGVVRRGGRMFYDGSRLLVPVSEGQGEVRLLLCCFDSDVTDQTAVLDAGLSIDDHEVLSFPLRPKRDMAVSQPS